MESQPQNPEIRNIPENFKYQCDKYASILNSQLPLDKLK